MAGQATSIVRNAGVSQPSLAIFCTVLHHVVCAGLAFAVGLLLPSVSSVWLCCAANMDSVLCCPAYVHILLIWLLMLAISNIQ